MTVGGVVAVRSLSVDAAPFAGVESTAPRPVQRMISPPGSPILAGRVFTPGIAPLGAAMLPSGLMATAMLLIAKMPGENGPTVKLRDAEAVPPRVTTTLAVPVVPLESTFHGS